MMLAFKLPNCDFLIYGLPDKAEAGNFTHVAMPLLFGFSALTTFGVGVRLSRITAEQRDQLLLDIVPPEVAEVLIRRVAQKQVISREPGRTGYSGRSSRT